MGRCRPLAVPLVACLALAAGARPGWADDELELPGELRGKTFQKVSKDDEAYLEKTARDQIDQKQWSHAITEYQRLIDEMGDRLIREDKDRPNLVHVRRLCHLRIASLPPEALQLYRNRVDAQAKKWLEQGTARRDAALLQRVVDEAFCSRSGDQALELLGDLAFERGRFGDAERWWRLLLTDFPDPQVDVARVGAKVLVSRLFRGERGGWDAELKAFRAKHPQAEGPLAGRQGRYGDILEALARQTDDLAIVEPDDWPAFGGGPSRSRVASRDPRDPNRLTRLCQFPPWRFDLEKRARLDDDAPEPTVAPGATRSAAARSLAFHPAIVGLQALVADARYVTAYDLNTGQPATWFDLKDRSPTPEADPKLPARPDLRYTLTVDGDHVFARLGAAELREPNGREKGPGANDSFLVCLSREPDPKGERFRWMVRPDPANRDTALFEGSPVARDGRVYIAVTRTTADQAITAIHCYAAESRDAPAPRWRQDVCIARKRPRAQHHLLTLAGPNVVYCSHSGAIIALDALTGRHVWAVRYTSRGPMLPGGEPSPRDLAPCLYAAGRLFAAPADADRIFCLDPATGQVLWQRDKVEVVHLLGAGMGRLIFTTPAGIRAVQVTDGRDVPHWQQPSSGSMPPFGRGILAGELVYWPTADGVHVLNQDDGSQPDDLTPLPPGKVRPGNLVFGDGCLVVADGRELCVYVPPARHRARQAERVGVAPDSAMEHYRLALAEADAGLHERALASFQRAEHLADQLLFGQADRLRQLAKQDRHEVLLEIAAGAQAARDWDRAAELLRTAAAEEFPTTNRLQAIARQAGLWEAANKPERAVAAWQSALEDERLRHGQVRVRGSNSQRAWVVAEVEISRLIDAHGRGVYDRIEERARNLMKSAGTQRKEEVLERLVGEYPNAEVAASARRELARLQERPVPAGGLGDGLQPLKRAWELPLAPSERLLVPAGSPWGDRLFFAAGQRLTCRDAATGKVCWSTALRCAPVWVGCYYDTVLAAGPDGVTSLRQSDGKLRWEYPSTEALSAFQIVEEWLFFLQDGRRLLALSAWSGRLDWTHAAPAPLIHPSGRASPHFGGHMGAFVVQSRAGQQQFLTLIRFSTYFQMPWSQAFAPRPPVVLAQVRSGIWVVSGPHQVSHVNFDAGAVLLDTGKRIPPDLRWTYTVPGDTTRTGEPPWLIGGGKTLLVLTARNYGLTAQRLDPATGKPLWQEERLLDLEPIDPDRIALDETSFYFAAGDVLRAHALDDGRRLWERPLVGPPGPWQVRRAGGSVIAYPAELPADHFQLRWLWGSLELQLVRPLDEPARRGFPLLVFDAKTGRPVQRLNFAPTGGGLTFRGGLQASLSWQPRIEHSRPQVAPAVVQTAQGAVVALPGRAWGVRGPKRAAEE